MSIKRWNGSAWTDVTGVKRSEGGFRDVDGVYRYEKSAWQKVYPLTPPVLLEGTKTDMIQGVPWETCQWWDNFPFLNDCYDFNYRYSSYSETGYRTMYTYDLSFDDRFYTPIIDGYAAAGYGAPIFRTAELIHFGGYSKLKVYFSIRAMYQPEKTSVQVYLTDKRYNYMRIGGPMFGPAASSNPILRSVSMSFGNNGGALEIPYNKAGWWATEDLNVDSFYSRGLNCLEMNVSDLSSAYVNIHLQAWSTHKQMGQLYIEKVALE